MPLSRLITMSGLPMSCVVMSGGSRYTMSSSPRFRSRNCVAKSLMTRKTTRFSFGGPAQYWSFATRSNCWPAVHVPHLNGPVPSVLRDIHSLNLPGCVPPCASTVFGLTIAPVLVAASSLRKNGHGRVSVTRTVCGSTTVVLFWSMNFEIRLAGPRFTVSMRLIEYLTASAVSGSPEWNFTPVRSRKVYVLPSFAAVMSCARCGPTSAVPTVCPLTCLVW